MSEIQHHFRTCNICEAMCGIDISYKDQDIINIKGDKDDPFSHGHMCPKALALKDFHLDKDRIKAPMKRTDQGWQEISWEQAFDEIVENISQIQQQHGKNALAVYLGNPNAHNLGNAIFLKPFLKALGTINRYSSASTDQMPHHVASNYMFGAGMLIPVPDIDRTQFMLIIGANPVVSNGSMMTAAGVLNRINAIKKRNGKVVVIDPKRTKTAKAASEHIFIKPEKDALLLLAIIHCIFENKQVNLGHLSDYVDETTTLEQLVKEFSPEVVSCVTGINASTIRTLANDFASAESAVCYSRMGASTQAFGGLCQWLTNVLNIITGNMDKEGGALFPLPAFNMLRQHKQGMPNQFGKYNSRVKKLPFFNGEFPVATLADEINTKGEGQIKSLITIAGNPVLSTPAGQHLAKAIESLDFMVSIDIYLNETTKHANIILPATTGIENSHFDIFFNSFAVRNTAKYSAPLFPASGQQKPDWQIIQILASKLTGIEAPPLTPEMILNSELQAGPYGEQGMSLKKLIDNPHGVDLGPLKPSLINRLLTENGKICLAPTLYTNDIPRLRNMLYGDSQNEDYPFALIGRRLVKSHNTWTQNSAQLIKGRNSCTLEIHPNDASRLNITHGQLVTVKSCVGSVQIEAAITEDIKPGVVSIPQGWGHNQPDTEMSVAATQPGISINDLTDANRIDELTGNAALNGQPVAITAA